MFFNSTEQKMRQLLDSCQEKLPLELNQRFEPYQVALVPKTRTFSQFAKQASAHNLSPFGALAWYCENVFERTLSPIEQGGLPPPLFIDLAEKMMHVTFVMQETTEYEELTDADRVKLNSAVMLANTWLRYPKRMELREKFEDRFGEMGRELQAIGVVQAAMNYDKFMHRLMNWN